MTKEIIQFDKDAYARLVSFLKPAELDQVPEELRHVRHRRDPRNVRQCYRKAFWYVLERDPEIPSIRIVHGFITDDYGVRIDHAWVELTGDVVFDGVLCRFYDKGGYYQKRHAVKEAEYCRDEAIKIMLVEHMYAPWHETRDVL